MATNLCASARCAASFATSIGLLRSLKPGCGPKHAESALSAKSAGFSCLAALAVPPAYPVRTVDVFRPRSTPRAGPWVVVQGVRVCVGRAEGASVPGVRVGVFGGGVCAAGGVSGADRGGGADAGRAGVGRAVSAVSDPDGGGAGPGLAGVRGEPVQPGRAGAVPGAGRGTGAMAGGDRPDSAGRAGRADARSARRGDRRPRPGPVRVLRGGERGRVRHLLALRRRGPRERNIFDRARPDRQRLPTGFHIRVPVSSR